MKTRTRTLCGIAALLALTTFPGCSLMNPPPAVAAATPVTLLGTHWRLTQLGGRIVDNPAGERDAHITLQAENFNVTGNSGCNRMFGRYALENDMLKFDGLGGTKMACEGRMELEQGFMNALMSVMRWKITGRTLELFDERGQAAATFEST